MSDETTEEGKERPKLKSLDEFKPEESPGRIFDFQKHKEEREEDVGEDLWPPKIRTKFCFKYENRIFNFEVETCGEDGYHIYFFSMQEAQTPFGKIVVQQPVTDSHVELNKFETFLTWFGMKFDMEKKIEKEAVNMKKKIVKFIDSRKKADKIKRKFKL